ncbi:hypothetical protein Tco_0193781 [Tanacetum coccineum]
MDDQIISSMPPQIIVFPSPLQWPSNSMFDLAELLCLSGHAVTFVHIPYTHTLLRYFHIESRLSPYLNFHLQTISDGLPSDHPRSEPTELLESLETMAKPVFKEWLTSEKCGLVSCIISDGNMGFVYDVGNEIRSPHGPGEVSDLTGSDLNSLIKRVPGIKGVLTGGDLASMCQSSDLASPSSKVLMKQFKELSRAHGVIFNTCKALDGSILSRIRSFCTNIYAIGPVHTHLAVRQEAKNIEPLLNYSVDENKNCLAWLDTRQPKSVLYVNIENEVKLTRVQVLELWHGLVNSGKGFLWVRQPESIVGDGRCTIPTLQGLAEGVPIICWPSSWDQQVNSKLVSKAWGLIWRKEVWIEA